MHKRLRELEMTDELNTEPLKFVCALKMIMTSFLSDHSQVLSCRLGLGLG